MTDRRTFIKGAGGLLAMGAMATSAKSYARIIGANERINVAVMGTRSRGAQLIRDYIAAKDATVTRICEIDSRIAAKTLKNIAERDAPTPETDTDIRRTLEDKDLDVLVIATPDHWHATAAVMGLQAGKHIYVEKPCAQTPAEGEILVAAQKHYGKVVQMGNQQRSAPETIELIGLIREGMLGEIYHVYTWYANNRGSIGNGKVAQVPAEFDWDLWQGPAPRREFHDNYTPYNWHWFWHWGTGETCNNALHELDIARWALGADYAERVEVEASRQFYADDDWEMYDTMAATYRFPGGKTVVWEGHSCNKVTKWGRGRGTMIYGTRGSAMVDRRGYVIHDLDGKVVREAKMGEATSTDSSDLVGGGALNDLHIANFLGTIRGTAKSQHSPIHEGNKSNLMCLLANIAYRTGGALDCDPANGHITNIDASKYWSREYEKGWELKV